MNSDPKNYRIDAQEKINGSAKYTDDLKIPDLWLARIIRSPHPCADIVDIHFDPEFDWKSVVVATAADIPNNFVSMLENDMPFLAEKRVNYIGEPVVLIAAPDKALLKHAAEHIEIKYEPLPYLTDMKTSKDSDILLYGTKNIFKEINIKNGSINQVKKDNLKKIEIEAHTGFQEHVYLEPQAIIAIPENDRIEIRGSLQCPYYIKNAVDIMFGGKKHITVIHETTGGAFGGKEDYPSLIAGHAAILAAKCGHPVSLVLDRYEDIQFTTKRHPSYHHLLAYVTDTGKIKGLEVKLLLNSGAYCTLSPVVLARAALTSTGSYFIPHVSINAKAVATNTVPSGAFRGFGGPQAVFAIEMLMEKIALTLNLTADNVREINLIKKGQQTATGQILKYSVSAEDVLRNVLKQSDYRKKYHDYRKFNQAILDAFKQGSLHKNKSGSVVKGIGASTSIHGGGFTGIGENRIKGKIRVEVEPSGMINLFTAQTEMGQGQQTAFQKILADALYLPPGRIKLSKVNTDLVPDSGPTVASRSTMIVGSLLTEAAHDIVFKLKNLLKEQTGIEFDYQKGYFHGNGEVYSFDDVMKNSEKLTLEKQYAHPRFIKFNEVNWRGDAYPVFSWAASVAEIEVDLVTFEIRVVRYYTTHDIGKAINYDQAIAQIQGGSLQGIGYALYETIKQQKGAFDVTGFTDYIIPTFTEMPEFHIRILENPYPFGPFGAKGLGELPHVGSAPAVISALWMIFKQEFNHIPFVPEDLYQLLLCSRNRDGN